MNCLICNKTYDEKEIANRITYSCTTCGFFKTKEKTKENDTYKSEFWEKSDYSEFTGTDFSDKKVTDLKLTFESWYSYFQPFLKNKKSILDIGSGTGISCILLENKGFQMTGVDPDPKNAELINSKLNNGKCINCFFEELKIEEKVDAIWITHVFEHLENPDEFLEKCKQWIKPDGIICLIVPDCGNPSMLESSVSNQFHIFHFSKNALKKLFDKHGYEMINCESLATMKKTNRRFHKVLRKVKVENISSAKKPYYPFEVTKNNDGYEIRCVLRYTSGTD